MDYLRHIYLDLNATPATISVKAKQGDAVHRKLAIHLLVDGQPTDTSGVASYQFRLQKVDGNAVILEGDGSAEPIEIMDGAHVVTLSDQCLAVAGRSPCDFVLKDDDGNALSTACFFLDIMPMPDVGSVIDSSTEWQTLQEAIAEAEKFADILSFRVENGEFQYTTDGETWESVGKVSEIVTPEGIGAQEALTGQQGQLVGFDESGQAEATDAYVKSVNGKTGEVTVQETLTGTAGQVVGFDAEGKAVPTDSYVQSVNGESGKVEITAESLDVYTKDEVDARSGVTSVNGETGAVEITSITEQQIRALF